MKKMFLANFNLTFGSQEEPLLEWLDEFVIPALKDGIKRTMTNKTKVMFENVELVEISENEFILQGIIIKDKLVDIYNQYDDETGLMDTDEHYRTSPYSSFIIYLKNHRMALIKRQSESPDLRLFSSTIQYVLKEYRKKENKKRKEGEEKILPYAVVGIKGIKDEKDISKALKDVEKIRKLTMNILPRNNELDKWNGLLDSLDEQVRKESKSKNVKLIVNSPQSKAGVINIITSTTGLVEANMEVEFYNDEVDENGKKKKKIGRIRDNEMSQTLDVDLPDDLRDSFEDVYQYCKNIDNLHVKTENIVSYQKFLEKRSRKK